VVKGELKRQVASACHWRRTRRTRKPREESRPGLKAGSRRSRIHSRPSLSSLNTRAFDESIRRQELSSRMHLQSGRVGFWGHTNASLLAGGVIGELPLPDEGEMTAEYESEAVQGRREGGESEPNVRTSRDPVG